MGFTQFLLLLKSSHESIVYIWSSFETFFSLSNLRVRKETERKRDSIISFYTQTVSVTQIRLSLLLWLSIYLSIYSFFRLFLLYFFLFFLFSVNFIIRDQSVHFQSLSLQSPFYGVIQPVLHFSQREASSSFFFISPIHLP